MAAAGLLACTPLLAACGVLTGLPADQPRLEMRGDTLVGAGTLAELRAQHARWRAARPPRYRFTRDLTCFCMPDAVRPHAMEVAGDSVVRVTIAATGAPAPIERAISIDDLFRSAIEWLERGGSRVTVAYHRELRYPLYIEIGTVADDSGLIYRIRDLRAVE